MVRMTIEMPEGALATLHQDPAGFVRELRLAAAVKWYELRRISQGRAAEIAGLSRAEFLTALEHFGVSPFQYGPEELEGAASAIPSPGSAGPTRGRARVAAGSSAAPDTAGGTSF